MADGLHRRVIVLDGADRRSAVAADSADLAIIRPTGSITLHEVWRQDHVPARPDDAAHPNRTGALEAPPGGAVVRILTIAPFAGEPDAWVPDLHCDDSLHIITMTAGQLDIVLQAGHVGLGPGDSIVLPGSMHDLRNVYGSPATFVYTSFPLRR